MCHQKWDFYGGPTFRKYTPQKIAAPSRKFLDENPMKGDGMSMAWMSFNLPNFFRGTPSPKPPFAPKKETESKKKTLNNPSNPHWVCLLQLPPPKKNHPLRTEKTGWASPRYFPPAGPEIRWTVACQEMTWLRQWLRRSQEDEGQLDWSLSNRTASKKWRSFFGAKSWKCRNLRVLDTPSKHLGNLRCWSSTIWCSETWVESFSKLKFSYDFVGFGIPKALEFCGGSQCQSLSSEAPLSFRWKLLGHCGGRPFL